MMRAIATPWREAVRFPRGFRYDGKPWTAAAITDPHCTPTPSSIRHGRPYEHLGDGAARLARCFDAMCELPEGERPAFVLLLGDIGVADAEAVLTGARRPVYPVAGNYEDGELRDRLRAMYPHLFETGDYYAFDHAGVRVVGLCSAGVGNDHVGHLASEGIRPPGQSEWLGHTLDGPWRPTVLFSHCPPMPPGFDRDAYLERSSHEYVPFLADNDSRFLISMMERRGPLLGLFGHQHRATYGFDVGPSHALVLRSSNWNHDGEAIGFLLLRIDRTGISLREILTGTPGGGRATLGG